jgi:hypothetical protein
LQTLTPGTEEHQKLQDALIKTAGIVEISIPTANYRINTSSEEYVVMGGFGSSEHVAIGEAVKLKGLPEANTPLIVKGGVQLRFQHIVALAGDFYGIAGEAISLPGGTDAAKTERFKKAFETLAQADHHELRRVLLEIDNECSAVKHSSLPHHCYSSRLIESNHTLKKIKKDINELLIDNSDHFSNNAEEAYRIGHAYALSMAREAGKRNDREGLKLACALDAYACHFLTDLFASGHIRNQRGKLEEFLIIRLEFSADIAKKLAGILTAAQHEKEGAEGLNVENGEGEQWRAYGDGCFFTPKNQENKEKAIAATQRSVDEIYTAFSTADQLGEEPFVSTVHKVIPHVTPYNPPPLYSIEGNSLFLYRGSDKIRIESKSDYLAKGISQALSYLPEEYISGFITPDIQVPVVLEKVVMPQIERVTGFVWHIVGVATYRQVKQETRQLNEKIDEMAGALMAAYETCQEIRRQIEMLHMKVDQLIWNDLFQEIQEPIAEIMDFTHECQVHKNVALNPSRLQEAEARIWKAYIRMSRIFEKGAASGEKILETYESLLIQRDRSMTSMEVKIAVTLWFRQMLDYQVQAFSLSTTLKIMMGYEQQKALTDVSDFQSSLRKQVEINKSHIDESLICESHSYIKHQLEKSKTRRLANSQLNVAVSQSLPH